MFLRQTLDRLALGLMGLAFLWFVEPAPTPGLQGGWFALLGVLLLVGSRGISIRLRWSQIGFGLLLAVVLLDLLLRRASYPGLSLSYLACFLAALLLLARQAPISLKFLAQVLAISAVLASLFAFYCRWQGNPVIAGKIYSIVNNELAGPMQQRNLFSSHLLLGLLGLVYWYVEGLKKSLWLAGVLIMGVALAMTQSRTGLLNIVLLASLGAWLIYRKNVLGKPVVITCALLMALQLLVPYVVEVSSTLTRMANDGALSHSELRVDASLRALKIFAAHPLLGVGFDNFTAHEHLIRLQDAVSYPFFVPQFSHSHNIFTQLLAEAGLLGGAAVLILLGVYLHKWWKVSDPHIAFALLGLTVLWVHSSLEYPLWYMHFFAVFIVFYSQIEEGKLVELRTAPLLKVGLSLLILFGSTHFLLNIWRLDKALQLQIINRGQAYELVQEVAFSGGPAMPYAQHVLLGMARPGSSLQTNMAMEEISAHLVAWKPDTFVSYHRALWLASVGKMDEAQLQLDRAYRVYPHKLPVFVRSLVNEHQAYPENVRSIANQAFAVCGAACAGLDIKEK